MIATLLNVFAEVSCVNINDDNGSVNKYCTNLPKPAASSTNVRNIIQIIFATLAVVVVLMIVISALNIVTADGDSAKVAKARSTILYALVGLAVAISADVIVSIIITRL